MTVVCVLGMSRSGTSLTTRVLNLAGVYLGAPEELLSSELRELPEKDRKSAREANAGGFWEHYRLMRLNERILRSMGGNWREPPPLPPGWENSPELDAEREEARSLIDQSFGGRELWGWKDPRNCLTLPFWEQLLPGMRYVVCLRNPLDVAASLQRRDGMAFEPAVALWLTYVCRALVLTSGRPRLLIRYESHFEAPEETAARLATFAGREGAFDDDGPPAAADQRLWRNRTSLCEIVAERRLPAEAVCLELLTGSSPVDDDALDLYARRLLG